MPGHSWAQNQTFAPALKNAAKCVGIKKTRRSKALKGNPNTSRHERERERERERMSACCLKRTCHFLYLNRVHHHLHCGLFLLLHTVACFQESCLRTKATLSYASIFFPFAHPQMHHAPVYTQRHPCEMQSCCWGVQIFFLSRKR